MVGVADTQKIQQDVVGVCRDVLEPPVAPDVTVVAIDGRPVVAVEVPELARELKSRAMCGARASTAGATCWWRIPYAA